VAGLELRRAPEGLLLRIPGEEPQRFDHAVFACHGDQVLPLLPDADPLEREVLGAFCSHSNETLLHTDAALLPPARRGWASWNVREAGPGSLRVTYHMNRLQPLGAVRDLFVSLNEGDAVAPDRVLRRMAYEHPRYDLAAVRAQARWAEVSGRRGVHFAGAYWRYGFHEDGVWSGARVARALGVDW
jgi:predicted NAD/FAD-binding protein